MFRPMTVERAVPAAGLRRIGRKLEQPGGQRRANDGIADLRAQHEIDETGVLTRAMGIMAHAAGGILHDNMGVVRKTPGDIR